MSYFRGVSRDPIPLAESAKAVMGNFFMNLTDTYNPIANAKNRYVKIKNKFEEKYKYTK